MKDKQDRVAQMPMPPAERDKVVRDSADGMGTERLEAFSDAVLAIAITILVLQFKVPEGAREASDWRLGDALMAQWPFR